MPPAVKPLDYLFALELHGVKLGLSNITHLLNRAGEPQRAYPTVHVAGTNGKGSVVAILDAILRAAGYKIGRFTSPHLCDIRERFLIDTQLIPPRELDQSIEYFRAIAETMDPSPTFFEVNTAIAFRHFQQQGVEIAIIEVGMGGRFDSTNVLTPEATCITNIALEHTRYLGNTLEAIAFEKAGIIKPSVPLVVTEIAPGPQQVILSRAEELGSPAQVINRDFTFEISGPSFDQSFAYDQDGLSFGPVPLALTGAYQGKNAAAAVAVAGQLRSQFPSLDQKAIERGLATAAWPCRLEKVLDDPPVIIDVAHNAAGAHELEATIDSQCIAVLAVSSDKNASAMIESLAPKADTFILTQFDGSRALPVDALCAMAGSHPYHRAEDLAAAIAMGIDMASQERPLIITGSLFTAGEARTILVEHYGAPPLRF